jgi:hypothetical protein
MSAAAAYDLELDGVFGRLASASGGDPEGVVLSAPPGGDGFVSKHIGGVRYTDLELGVDIGQLSEPLSEWIAGTIGYEPVAKSGTVHAYDENMKEIWTLKFFDALIREVRFPALDASSKAPARLTIIVAPVSAKRAKGTGQPATAMGPQSKRRVLASSFRLSIDDVTCERVIAIRPITIRQNIVEKRVGNGDRRFEPEGGLEVGELVVSIPGVDGDGFIEWINDFVVDGGWQSANEKTGKLELLSSDLKTVVFTMTFAGLGIFGLQQESGDAQRAARWRASMYVEKVRLAKTEPALL